MTSRSSDGTLKRGLDEVKAIRRLRDRSRAYYMDDLVTLYHADSLQEPDLWQGADVLVTDPPYGLEYRSSFRRNGQSEHKPRLSGDESTWSRDAVLDLWGGKPALVFGSWKTRRPDRVSQTLVWDKSPYVGMGDLSIPWGPSWEEIYVLGKGFSGKRQSGVLHYLPVSVNFRHSGHPTPKPVDLMESLISHCPEDWVIVDPFAGSGATLVAARNLGRRVIGVEVEERWCREAVKRLSQPTLPMHDLEQVDGLCK